MPRLLDGVFVVLWLWIVVAAVVEVDVQVRLAVRVAGLEVVDGAGSGSPSARM